MAKLHRRMDRVSRGKRCAHDDGASVGRYTSCIAVQSDDRNDSNHRLTSGIRHSSFRVATPAAIVAVYDCRARSPPSPSLLFISLLFSFLRLRMFRVCVRARALHRPRPPALLALSSSLCPTSSSFFLFLWPRSARSSALDPTRYRPHSRVQRRGRDICICIRVHRSVQPPHAAALALASRYIAIAVLYYERFYFAALRTTTRFFSFAPFIPRRLGLYPIISTLLPFFRSFNCRFTGRSDVAPRRAVDAMHVNVSSCSVLYKSGVTRIRD